MSAIEKNGPESPSPGMKGAAWTEHVRTSCCGESDSVTRIVTYCDLLSQNHHTPTFALCPSSPHLQSSGLYSLKIASHSHKTPTIQTSAAHQSSWWPPCHPCVTMTSSPHTHDWVWSQSGPYHQEARVWGSDLYYVWTFNNTLTKRLMAAINRRQSCIVRVIIPECALHIMYTSQIMAAIMRRDQFMQMFGFQISRMLDRTQIQIMKIFYSGDLANAQSRAKTLETAVMLKWWAEGAFYSMSNCWDKK